MEKKTYLWPKRRHQCLLGLFFVQFVTIHRRRRCRSLGLLWLYPFPPRKQLLAAVVLTGGVMAMLVAVVVWRQRHRYTIDKTYYYVRKNEIKQQKTFKEIVTSSPNDVIVVWARFCC